MKVVLITRVGEQIELDVDVLSPVLYLAVDIMGQTILTFDQVSVREATETIQAFATYIERISDVIH